MKEVKISNTLSGLAEETAKRMIGNGTDIDTIDEDLGLGLVRAGSEEHEKRKQMDFLPVPLVVDGVEFVIITSAKAA